MYTNAIDLGYITSKSEDEKILLKLFQIIQWNEDRTINPNTLVVIIIVIKIIRNVKGSNQ